MSLFKATCSKFIFSIIAVALICAPSKHSNAPSSVFSPFVKAAASTTDSVVNVNICHIRMPALDGPHILAGLLSAVHQANTNLEIHGVNFSLVVASIPCPNVTACTPNLLVRSPTDMAVLSDFLNVKMQTCSFVIKPNSFLSTYVINKAKQLGNMPVFAPATVRDLDFEPGSEHIINFRHRLDTEVRHMFTFMHQDDGCAFTGIVYNSLATIPRQVVDSTIKLFSDGGLPMPAVLNVGNASTQQFSSFFTEEPRRKCFIMLLSHERFVEMASLMANSLGLVNNETYKHRFYGPSLLANDRFVTSDGLSWPFAFTFFTAWHPPYNDAIAKEGAANNATELQMLRTAFRQWRFGITDEVEGTPEYDALVDAVGNNSLVVSAVPPADLVYFVPAVERVPTTIVDTTLGAYLIAKYAMRVYGVAVNSNPTLFNRSAAVAGELPLNYPLIVDAAYNSLHIIGDFPFGRIQRKCPIKPFAQTCFCNIASLTSFVYRVDGVTGLPSPVYDDISLGHRDAASVAYTSPCAQSATGRMYPITVMMLTLRSDHAGLIIGAPLTKRVEVQRNTALIFSSVMQDANSAPVPPSRPYNFALVEIDKHSNTMGTLAFEAESYNTFIILSSAEGVITSSDHLVLMPGMLDMAIEDPLLTNHSQWNSHIVNVQPVFADFMHAVAAFYQHTFYADGLGSSTPDDGSTNDYMSGANADRPRRYTDTFYIATFPAEAELMSKSLASFGFDVPVSKMIISADPAVWSAKVREWIASSKKPFIFAACSKITTIAMAAYQQVVHTADPNAEAIVAIVGPEPEYGVFQFPFTSANKVDVIFGALLRDWWMPDMISKLPVAMQPMGVSPMAWFPLIALEITQQLAQYALSDLAAKAASIFYKQSVLTAMEVTFGPISNTTCSQIDIATNNRDRSCQCTKGPRTFHVLSARSWSDRTSSTPRTGGFSLTYSTCGVNYKPYVRPFEFELIVNQGLSSGAIAGIAVGASIGGLLLLAAMLAVYCFSGRNNRCAPKDPSQPFAIVFTDIQGSTALWSRIPAIMSAAVDQHHAVIRRQIWYNKGYEVKTIGDSFMVAFKDVHNAVAFALSIQEDLFEADWDGEIDATYNELLAEAAAAAAHTSTNEEEEEEASRHAYAQNDFDGTTNTDGNESSTRPKGLPLPRSMNGDEAAGQNSSCSNAAGAGTTPAVVDDVYSVSADGNSQRQAQFQQEGVTPAAKVLVDVLEGNTTTATHRISDVGGGDKTGGQGTTAHSVTTGYADLISSFFIPEAHPYTAKQHAGTAADARLWHGLRVRIGVSYGVGEIRKDPISQGYDYYGTVVNTAARVEGVGHGGQTVITAMVLNALGHSFVSEANKFENQQQRRHQQQRSSAVNNNDRDGRKGSYQTGGKDVSPPLISTSHTISELGACPIRGLDSNVVLYQLNPKGTLAGRRFPPLRLEIEIDDLALANNDKSGGADGTDERASTTSGSITRNSTALNSLPLETATIICSTKQFSGRIAPEEILQYYHFANALLGPTAVKFQNATLAKIGDSWGFEKANYKLQHTPASRIKLIVNLVAKVTQTLHMKKTSSGVKAAGAALNSVNDFGSVTNNNNNNGAAHLTSSNLAHTNGRASLTHSHASSSALNSPPQGNTARVAPTASNLSARGPPLSSNFVATTEAAAAMNNSTTGGGGGLMTSVTVFSASSSSPPASLTAGKQRKTTTTTTAAPNAAAVAAGGGIGFHSYQQQRQTNSPQRHRGILINNSSPSNIAGGVGVSAAFAPSDEVLSFGHDRQSSARQQSVGADRASTNNNTTNAAAFERPMSGVQSMRSEAMSVGGGGDAFIVPSMTTDVTRLVGGEADGRADAAGRHPSRNPAE